ncbi:MAG: hypothetical protein HYV38_01650, partial [Candidatus Levybacteria bacterium]|nr:hypothetical protein [Candidatus Levybacteria bacterium]
ERGLTLLSGKGILNYILPHKWVNSAFGLGIRRFIHANKSAKKLISFGAYQVFNASNYTSLLWLTRNSNDALEYFAFSRDLTNNQELEEALKQLTQENFNTINNDLLDESPWVLTDKETGRVLDKLEKQPRRVKGVFKKIFQGIATSDDKVFVLMLRKENTDTSILFSKALNEEVELEKDLLRPFLMGKDVHRYRNLQTKTHIVFPYIFENEVYKLMNINDLSKKYPLGWRYLLKNEERLKKREHGIFKDNWWCFSRPQNMESFERQKIVTPEISSGSNMTLDY